MSKLRLWSIIFLVIAVIAFVSLTVETFGHMNPDTIIISASVFGIGILGTCICTIVRVVHEYELKKKKYSKRL